MIHLIQNPIVRKQNSAILSANSASSSPNLGSQPTVTRPLLAETDLVPANSTPHPLSRKSTTASSSSRAMPAVLAPPPNLPLPADPQRSVPSLARPDPRMWAGMGEDDRQRWLKEAQKTAKEKGQTLVNLAR